MSDLDPIIIHVPGEAVPFARAGANGKKRFTPGKQRNAMAVLRDFAMRAMDGRPPLEGPLMMQLRATYVVPPSWPKKRKIAAVWKSSKPDIDNIQKLAKDAMNKVVFHDDAQIAYSDGQKKYGPVASLVITVAPLEVK